MKTRILFILLVFAMLTAHGADIRASSSANLSSISITPAALLTNTGTVGSITTFTTSVDASTTSVTQTAAPADVNATMTVNGIPVASGTASGNIALNASGTTTITTVVTAPAGNTRTYQIVISKNGSTIATLQSISISPAATLTNTGTVGTTTTYTASVGASVTSVTQKAVTNDAGATMTVNGVTVASGTASGSIAINASGTTTITTVVTAAAGNTRTYQLIISKNPSNIASLKSISISVAASLTNTGTVGSITTFTTSVDASVTSVTQTAVTTDVNATMTVNGIPVASGTASGSIALNASGTTTITTVVTAPAGNTRTYQIIISKNGSTTATLQSISISPAATLTNTGTVGTTTTYTTSVDASVTNVTQKAVTTDVNATMTVNGVTVASGTASGSIAINASGTTTITTIVTAPAGNTRTYQVIISKNGSNIASLKSISISPAASLTNTGAVGSITTFTTSVDASVTSVAQTAVTTDVNATMTVNGIPVASGTASGSIALNASGTTTITTVVTAAAGNTRTYQIIISKNGSNIASLKSISINPAATLANTGTAGTTTTYTTSVDASVTNVTQKAVTTDVNATMTVNGVTVASGTASGGIALNINGITIITTVVTAPAGNTRTYQIIITQGTVNPVYTTWTGAAGTLWSNPGNWTSGVPVSYTDVTIPAATNNPVLDVAVTCNSITIDGSTTITVNNKLDVTGLLNIHTPYTLKLAGNNGVTVGGLLTIGVSGTVDVSETSVLTLNTALILSNDARMINNSKLITKAGCVITFNGGANPCTLINNGLFTAAGTFFELTDGTSINNTGTLTADALSEFTLGDQNSSIINSGTFNAGSSGSKCSIMITGQNSSINNSGTFILGSASVIYPSGDGAKIINTSSFTLKSDLSGSAAIGTLGNGAACTGNFSVERYISGGAGFRGYRLVSSPVYGNTVGSTHVYSINYLQNSAYLTGTTGAAGGFDKAGNPTLYLYRENLTASNASFTTGNFRGINTIGTGVNYDYLIDGDGNTPFNIPAGAGFLFFFRGDRAADALANETVPGYVSTPATLTTTGILNQGNVDVKEWYGAANLKATNTGFTLVGNPYASSIDLDTFNGANGTTGIIGTNLFPNIYVLNPITKNYGIYNPTNPLLALNGASNIIASGQGFFVQADPLASSASLTFTEAAKIPATQATPGPGGNFMMGMPAGPYDVRQMLRIKLVVDTFNYDDIAIAFNSNSSPDYNNLEDSKYLVGMSAAEGLASFSTGSDPVALSINFLPLPKKTQQVIRLKVDAANSGRLTLKKTQLDSLPKIYDLWLMDRYKKDSLDIRNNSSYAFDINKSDTGSYGDNRFALVVRQNPAWNIHLLSFTATKATDGAQTAWKTENEENYTNFTIERSTDNGVTFDVLGGFASNSQGVYTFTDKNPVNNAVDIYRLKIEDLNGAITYSKTIALAYGDAPAAATSAKINVYPNPARGLINLAINPGTQPGGLSGIQSINKSASLQSNQSYAITIVNVSGSVVKSAISSQPGWQYDTGTLLPGTYVIQVLNNTDKSIVGKATFVKL